MLIKRLLGCAVLSLTMIPAYMMIPARPVPEPEPAVTIESHIKEAAQRYDVSEQLVVAVIEVESQFNPRAVSNKGAQGLMQLMPATAASLGVRDAFDPRDNIHGGVKHLRFLMERFDNDVPRVLVAYNAGERVALKQRPVPRETREYVKRVMERMQRDQARS